MENTLSKRLTVTDYSQRDDIDLFALLETLFLAKARLFLITFCFAAVGLAVAFLLPQKWTSQAIIVAPEMPELIEIRKELTELQVLDIKEDVSADGLYQLFIKRFDSTALQKAYLNQSSYIKNKLENTGADNTERRRLIVRTAERIKLRLNNAENKKDPQPYTAWSLTFTAETADDAQSVLKGYIDYVTTGVEKEVIDNLTSSLELRIQAEKDKLALDRQALENEHNINIQRLNYSLEVANAAGIKQPVYSHGQAVKDDPDYSVALGSDGLAQKLKIEQSITDVSHLNASIQNREMRLSKMQQIHIQGAHFQPYKFQMEPSWPVKKEGPGKALVLVLFTLLGFIIASGYVLLNHAVKSRSGKTATQAA